MAFNEEGTKEVFEEGLLAHISLTTNVSIKHNYSLTEQSLL
jgi:hypothetical protein